MDIVNWGGLIGAGLALIDGIRDRAFTPLHGGVVVIGVALLLADKVRI